MNKKIETFKKFAYETEGISLTFTLNVDNQTELKKFLTLIEQAQKDIKKLLEK